jgi:hypothetical protein
MATQNGNTPSALTQERPDPATPQFNAAMLNGEFFKYTAILRKFHKIDSTEELIDTGDLVATMVNAHLFRMLADYLAGQPHHEPPHSSAIVDAHKIVMEKWRRLDALTHSLLVCLYATSDELEDLLRAYVDCQAAVLSLCGMFGDNMAEKFAEAVGGFKRVPHSFDR